MDGVVTFDPRWFLSLYPEFEGVAVPRLTANFTKATGLCDNTPASRISDASPEGIRALCLAALTAHFLALSGLGVGNESRTGLVGRISSASQGSVSVSVDMPSSESSAWYMQTQYGAEYWQLTAPYRLFMYVRGRPGR